MTRQLWAPSADTVAAARVTQFRELVNQRHSINLADFSALYDWSIAEPARFWSEVWDYCGVISSARGDQVLENADQFPGADWFPQARLNFAENLLRYRDDSPALISLLESGARREFSYAQLYAQVEQLASSLRASGVQVGDRVAGFMPNIIETVVAMLATSSIGAIWSSCSPEFGLSGVLDRFGQIKPRVLLGADGYYYNGKAVASLERLAQIAQQIDSIERVVVVPVLTAAPELGAIREAVYFEDYLDAAPTPLVFEQLPFAHPLYVMFSSGTTGVPKCIVHGAGGTLLQHLKEHQLLVDMRREDVFFYFTTCGWMMWNWLVSGLASGATLLLYDGSPFAADGQFLLDAIDREKISVFGASAKYIAALEKAGLKPAQSHDLSSLRSILSTGSPLSHESFEYVYRDFKSDVCLSSISGGTDIISCFVGGCPVLPVYLGEIQARGLGMAVEIWDEEGRSVREQKGELVCTAPFPCAPVMFWNDPDGQKYHDAYFERFPGVWAQGDYGEITASGGVIIHGRSDAVLNPGGVRIGTAEIYRQVERLEQVQESIVVGQQWNDDVRVVLFVVLAPGQQLDAALEALIRGSIRDNTTPRHVPAKIIAVADIPRTISGKIVELAVRNVIHGLPVKNTDALANPQALALYRDLPALQQD